MSQQPITLKQIRAIAKLLRAKEHTTAAVCMVMLDDLSVSAVAERTGMSQPSVSQAVKRFKEADGLIRGAYSA